jgi:hypothetical protein
MRGFSIYNSSRYLGWNRILNIEVLLFQRRMAQVVKNEQGESDNVVVSLNCIYCGGEITYSSA